MATQTIPIYHRLSSVAVFQPRPRSSAQVFRRPAMRTPDTHQLLLEMLPMVKRLAFQIREHLPAHVDVNDLISNGTLGLVDAIAKFDTGKRVKFASYARHRVRGAILDGLRSTDPASRDLRRTHKKIHRLYRDMAVQLGRPARDEEMAAAMGMNLPQWHRTLSEIQSVGLDGGARTISAGPHARRPSAEPAQLAGHEADAFDQCYRRERQEMLARALASLRQREREIIALYYQHEYTMKQIGERLHIDESRVSQLHSAALMRLKSVVNSLLARTAKAAPKQVLSTAAAV